MKLLNKSVEKNLNTYRNLIAVATVIFYIMFSIIKRFAENTLIIIPMILFLANALILLEIYFGLKKIGDQSGIKNEKWIVIQFLVNLGFVLLCVSYLI